MTKHDTFSLTILFTPIVYPTRLAPTDLCLLRCNKEQVSCWLEILISLYLKTRAINSIWIYSQRCLLSCPTKFTFGQPNPGHRRVYHDSWFRNLIGSIITYVDILVSASLPITHVSWKQCVGSNLSRTPVSGYWGYDLRYVWFSTHSCFMKCGLLCLSSQTWHSWFTKQVQRSFFY